MALPVTLPMARQQRRRILALAACPRRAEAAGPWDALLASLQALARAYEQEGAALLTLDAERAVQVLHVKKAAVAMVLAARRELGGAVPGSVPPEVAAVAGRCRRLSALNQRLLSLMIGYIRSLVWRVQGGEPSRPAMVVAPSGLLDVKA